MNQYLKIFILSIVYYLIYLFLTLQAIPFVHSLFNQSVMKMQSIKLHFGPIPIGYILMLLFAAITIFAIEEIKARKSKHDK